MTEDLDLDREWIDAVLHLVYAMDYHRVPPVDPAERRSSAMDLVLLAARGDLPEDPGEGVARELARLATEAFPGLLADLQEAEAIGVDGTEAEIDRSRSRVARLARLIHADSYPSDTPPTDPEEDQ